MLTAIALAACSGGNPAGPESGPAEALSTTPAATGGTPATVELRYDQPLVHEGLELRLAEISDSRCPIGVTCVWEGEVAVSLEAARGSEAPVEVKLTLPARTDRNRDQAVVHGYLLRLLAVEPHPKYGVTTPREGHVVRLEIRPA